MRFVADLHQDLVRRLAYYHNFCHRNVMINKNALMSPYRYGHIVGSLLIPHDMWIAESQVTLQYNMTPSSSAQLWLQNVGKTRCSVISSPSKVCSDLNVDGYLEEIERARRPDAVRHGPTRSGLCAFWI
jgi:hypothetical protein